MGKNNGGGLAGHSGPAEVWGEGGSLTDAAVLLEELGRGPAPGLFFSTAILSVLSLLEAGSEEQRSSRPYRSSLWRKRKFLSRSPRPAMVGRRR